MLLSQLIQKPLLLNKTPRGMLCGVGLSPKNKTIKYLFCSTHEKDDFVLPIDALANFSENALFLSRLRPILPKPCCKVYLGLPIYTFDGKFLGKLADVEIQNDVAIRFFTDQNECFSLSSISVISDAIILKKSQPYPLGQPFQREKEGVITKRTLRNAIKQQSLIRLTLSLPPFYHSLF